MSYWTIEEMTEENYSTFLRLEDEKEEILCNYPVPGISFNPLHYKGTNKQSRDISLLQYKLNLFPKYFLHFLFKKSVLDAAVQKQKKTYFFRFIQLHGKETVEKSSLSHCWYKKISVQSLSHWKITVNCIARYPNLKGICSNNRSRCLIHTYFSTVPNYLLPKNLTESCYTIEEVNVFLKNEGLKEISQNISNILSEYFLNQYLSVTETLLEKEESSEIITNDGAPQGKTDSF